jgi:hypothetical protein
MVWDEQIQCGFIPELSPKTSQKQRRVATELTFFSFFEMRFAVGPQPNSSACDADHNWAEICTGAAGFCSLPSNIAAPFNRS